MGLGVAFAAPARCAAPESSRVAASERPVVRLVVSPATIRVGGMSRQQQVLVTGHTDEGRLVDLTHRAQFSVGNSAVAQIEQSVVRGVRDGRTELHVRFGEQSVTVPIQVAGYDSYPPLQFASDILPLLAKLGCNSGGCHGKQSGQNGFKLSVFGFDPDADYSALVHEARGRRVFPADPARSLLVLKAIGRLPHGGGLRADPESLDTQLMVEWIRQGMPWGVGAVPDVVELTVEPGERLALPASDQQLLVTARMSDGSTRDVTAAAGYSSNAESIATVGRAGRIQIGATPGEAAVSINYMGHMATARVIVPRATPAELVAMPTDTEIDRLVLARLRKLGLAPSSLCDDATFLRRVHIQTLGLPPSADEVRAFLADSTGDSPTNSKAVSNAEKRRRLIDRVLERDEYADLWALKWADILLVDQQALGPRGAYQLHAWLREQFATNRPYDQWARELVTASGNSAKHGPVNFYRAVAAPADAAKAFSQAFLGIRMDCAQCHHHPFEKWGQNDFYGLTGFFSGLERKELSPGRQVLFHGGLRPAKHPRTGVEVPIQPPDGPRLDPAQFGDNDPRAFLADWMTRPDNPYFARLVANRLWKHFLGRGLVEPEDDLRSTNPATNEPLLDYLTAQVVARRYDLKALMREIMNSRAYQLSSEPNETNGDDEQNFSRHLVTRLPAEVLLDAISHATGSPEEFVGLPRGTRAVQAWDNRLPSYFLDTFGRSQRESPCECGKSGEPTMAQALHLMNAPEIEAKIGDAQGRVARLVEAGASRDRMVDELCLHALGRLPNERERGIAARLFAQRPPREAGEDFLWTLLNSYDFLFLK